VQRIPALDPATANADIRASLDAVKAKLGMVPNIMNTMARAPSVLNGYLAFSAAISRHVAMLERNLGVRLFQRSSRSLNLTEDGDRFLASVTDGVESIQPAIVDVTTHSGKPALKVSVALTFGLDHVLPFLPAFMKRYPDVQLDWSFENRQVDLIGEGFDAAIGGGMN
jgi:DNA-binding transcriptional LysR family regulator